MKQRIKNDIKLQLWRFGHRVKDAGIFPGLRFDLLVNGKERVCVFERDDINIDSRAIGMNCDIVATEKNGRKIYARVEDQITSTPIQWKSPSEIFKKGGVEI